MRHYVSVQQHVTVFKFSNNLAALKHVILCFILCFCMNICGTFGMFLHDAVVFRFFVCLILLFHYLVVFVFSSQLFSSWRYYQHVQWQCRDLL